MRLIKWLCALAVAGASIVHADTVYLGNPSYAGTGCPPRSVAASLSPDQKALSVLFSEYVATAEGATTVDRRNCNLAVPVHVPQGLSFSILEVDYRGYNSLPQGANSVLTAQYFFAGSAGPSMMQSFNGPMDAEYYVPNKLGASALVWSPCGTDVNLRINSAIRVKTNLNGDQAMSTVDSADIAATLKYLLSWRTCH